MVLARVIGGPLQLDNYIAGTTNGYYAMVLVDMDLLYEPADKV